MTALAPQFDPRLAVTLLTGFLGAGKTTLLNAALHAPDGPKIAVVVNEFGEAGLDHDLIEAVDEEVVLMRSGCLCCSIRGDLSRTIKGLLARRDAGEVSFDRVMIETTGLANPGPVLQTLQADPWLQRHVRMDGIVTVADAATGPATLDRHFEAVSQVAMADLLVISKTDLVAPEAGEAFQRRLHALNPTARILRARRGDLPAGVLWGLGGSRKGAAPVETLGWLGVRDASLAADPFANLSGMAMPRETGAGWHSPHDAEIGSASVVLEEPIPAAAFDLWLDTLIALRGPDILRVKGIVFIEGVDTPFVFHGVQHVFDEPVPLPHWPEGDRRSRIVVIARDITGPELTRSLDMLRARLPRERGPSHSEEINP